MPESEYDELLLRLLHRSLEVVKYKIIICRRTFLVCSWFFASSGEMSDQIQKREDVERLDRKLDFPNSRATDICRRGSEAKNQIREPPGPPADKINIFERGVLKLQIAKTPELMLGEMNFSRFQYCILENVCYYHLCAEMHHL